MGPQENHSAKTHFEQKERKSVVIFLQRYLTFLIMLQKFCNVFLLQKKILQHLFFQFLGWAINVFFIKMQHCCVLMKNVARGPLALLPDGKQTMVVVSRIEIEAKKRLPYFMGRMISSFGRK